MDNQRALCSECYISESIINVIISGSPYLPWCSGMIEAVSVVSCKGMPEIAAAA